MIGRGRLRVLGGAEVAKAFVGIADFVEAGTRNLTAPMAASREVVMRSHQSAERGNQESQKSEE